MRREEAPRRVLGYARVSSVGQEQHGESLNSQREELTRYCRSNGYPDPQLFVEVESGGLGKEEERTEQVRLMTQAREGDLVLCCKQDRWSRDTLHYLSSVRAIMSRNARFFSIAEKFDPTTPEGEFASTVMAAVARQEHARIKERTVGTRRKLRLAGAYVEGLAPLGYTIKDRKLVVDPGEAKVVRRTFELATAGKSTRQIADFLREKFPGVTGIDHAATARRLKDRRYLGETNTIGAKGRAAPRGEWIKTHEAIIDAGLWERAQAALKARRVGGRPASGDSRTAAFLLRGLVYCAHCKRKMTAHDPGPDRSTKHGGYYLCRRRTEKRLGAKCERGPTARRDAAEARFGELWIARLEELAQVLAKPIASAKPSNDTEDDGLDAERAKLIRRRTNLIDAIADGVLSRDAARAKMQSVETALADADARRAALEKPRAPTVDRAALLLQVKHLRRAWSLMNLDAKRKAIPLLADGVEIASTSEKKWERGAWELRVLWRETR